MKKLHVAFKDEVLEKLNKFNGSYIRGKERDDLINALLEKWLDEYFNADNSIVSELKEYFDDYARREEFISRWIQRFIEHDTTEICNNQILEDFETADENELWDEIWNKILYNEENDKEAIDLYEEYNCYIWEFMIETQKIARQKCQARGIQ